MNKLINEDWERIHLMEQALIREAEVEEMLYFDEIERNKRLPAIIKPAIIKIDMKAAIIANTLDDLTVKSIGLFHDRCYHLFRGKVEDVPSKYKNLIRKDDKGYVLIYKE